MKYFLASYSIHDTTYGVTTGYKLIYAEYGFQAESIMEKWLSDRSFINTYSFEIEETLV